MVAHYSGSSFLPLVRSLSLTLDAGTTLDAQARYAAGTKQILDNWFYNKPQTPADIIVENGDYATKAYGQREKK